MYKIVAIEDTRSWDFETGKPISGSGCQRPCDHCGKAHDVVVVLDDNGKRMDVGTTCAKKLGGYGMDTDSKALGFLAMQNRIKELAQLLWDTHGVLTNRDMHITFDFCKKHTMPALKLEQGNIEWLLDEYYAIKTKASN